MSQPTVIVVPTGDGDGDGSDTPPAGPAYVTAGELDARLELQRTQLTESISEAVATAWRAQAAAEDAQETAIAAAAVAGEAAAAVDENLETADDDQGPDAVDEVDEAPRAPERRTAPAPARVQPSGGGSRSKSYGAGWLSGGR